MSTKQPKGLAATDLKKDRVYRCVEPGYGAARGDAVMVYDKTLFPSEVPVELAGARFVLDEGVRDAKAGIAMRKANKIRRQKA